MEEQFDTLNAKIIMIADKRLAGNLTGFAMEGKSVAGNEGVLVFIPMSKPDEMIRLLAKR